MKIIVADDEAPARFLLASYLKDEGFEAEDILEASDGEELVARVRQNKPRIAFVDIRMPGLDGLAALERCVPLAPETAWVIVSSFAEFEYARSALRLGVTEYLVKPVNPADLHNCLFRHQLLALGPERDPVIGKVLDHIEENYNADVSIGDLADMMNLTPNYLSSLFHKKVGETFMSYLTRVRVTKARQLLQQGTMSVTEAARTVGYADVRHFSRRYKEVLGEYPSDSKADHKS